MGCARLRSAAGGCRVPHGTWPPMLCALSLIRGVLTETPPILTEWYDCQWRSRVHPTICLLMPRVLGSYLGARVSWKETNAKMTDTC